MSECALCVIIEMSWDFSERALYDITMMGDNICLNALKNDIIKMRAGICLNALYMI